MPAELADAGARSRARAVGRVCWCRATRPSNRRCSWSPMPRVQALTPVVRRALRRRLEETGYIFVQTDRLAAGAPGGGRGARARRGQRRAARSPPAGARAARRRPGTPMGGERSAAAPRPKCCSSWSSAPRSSSQASRRRRRARAGHPAEVVASRCSREVRVSAEAESSVRLSLSWR